MTKIFADCSKFPSAERFSYTDNLKNPDNYCIDQGRYVNFILLVSLVICYHAVIYSWLEVLFSFCLLHLAFQNSNAFFPFMNFLNMFELLFCYPVNKILQSDAHSCVFVYLISFFWLAPFLQQRRF